MVYELSCGFVAYQECQGERLFLIIRSRNGEYGFPKGHMENNETEYETAIRELKEETNLEVHIMEGFRRQVAYRLPKKANTMKRSVYFLGKCTGDKIVCQESEISQAMFVPMESALALLSFENTKMVLKEADAYLNSIDSV